MRRKQFVMLLTGAVLSGAHAQAGGAQNDMPRQETNTQQQEQHVVASPNPTIDDSKSTSVEPGKVTVERVEPNTATTAAPMKKATKSKSKRKSSQ